MKKQPEHTNENSIFSNLENYQSFDVEADWKKVRQKAGFGNRQIINSFWWAAAVALVILGVGFLSNQKLFSPDIINMATSDNQLEIILPDGSKVHLNSHSRLTYPEKFRRIRNVTLSGEGFFEVKKDPKHPFDIDVNELANVEVLGTSFNVNAPIGNKSVNIQVVEGKVYFSAHGQTGSGTILVMNEQAEYRDGEIIKKSRPDKNFLSWKTGIIHFDRDKISTVMEILSRYYGREIILDPAIDQELIFTSTIDNQELEDVLEEISLVLNLKITYNPDAITISKRN